MVTNVSTIGIVTSITTVISAGVTATHIIVIITITIHHLPVFQPVELIVARLVASDRFSNHWCTNLSQGQNDVRIIVMGGDRLVLYRYCTCNLCCALSGQEM